MHVCVKTQSHVILEAELAFELFDVASEIPVESVKWISRKSKERASYSLFYSWNKENYCIMFQCLVLE